MKINDLDLKLEGKLPVTRNELIELISSWGRVLRTRISDDCIIDKCEPQECYPLENLDVSKITNFSSIFRASLYNGNLSKWDVSNVTNMEKIFSRSIFNNNSIENWDVSNVIDMKSMFFYSNFNGNISFWNISNVLNLNWMFSTNKFNGDISSWNFNKDSDCDYLFYGNDNFKNKYNVCNDLLDETENFLKWFEENRTKIASLNITKEEELDIDDYLSDFNDKDKELKNDR